MISLPIDLKKFNLFNREKGKDGKIKKNRCGRDALYYVLHYYFPDKFNLKLLSPEKIEKQKLFGFLLPDWLPIFSGTTLSKIPKLLTDLKLSTYVNGQLVKTEFDFLMS